MLVKLALGSILLLLFSCKNKTVYYTELVCKDEVVLIRFASAKDVRKAVEDALFLKKKYRSNEDFTVMRFEGNRSFVIEHLLPEEAVNCDIREIPTGLRYKYYEKYYH
ncbi:MAG: hypothetical protein ISQ34_04070 [Rickettsiales bacterium]|nr:hypothetical protein [Rickettsiales bacterium]